MATTEALRYHDGDPVKLGDIVDVGCGNGPTARVVVIVPTGEAVPGFTAAEWSYLERGVMLQDTKVFGLLHADTLGHEYLLLSRAAPRDEA